jgi:Pectinacetylesterase
MAALLAALLAAAAATATVAATASPTLAFPATSAEVFGQGTADKPFDLVLAGDKFVQETGAACLDGSKPGFYFRKSPSGSTSKWVVFLQVCLGFVSFFSSRGSPLFSLCAFFVAFPPLAFSHSL